MNSFMNALYNATGAMITGFYNEEPFIGTITDVRAKAGVELAVTIDTGDNNTLVLTGTELHNGSGTVTTNLHVYF